MNEAIRNLALLLWAACSINQEAYAQTSSGISEEQSSPTVVFSSAATPDGKQDFFVVEQPAEAPNPLGNPIPTTASTTQQNSSSSTPAAPAEAKKSTSPQPNTSDLGSDFQNTLMEANGMVYDIQAYPKADIPVIENSAEPETIYSPNVNP